MNRTQKLALEWLASSHLEGQALVLEALLRRGFLAFEDASGLWLGAGSHPFDLQALSCIDGLSVVKVHAAGPGYARVRTTVNAARVARSIVSLPEHHVDGVTSHWTGTGILNLKAGWGQYRRMAWGAKRAVCGSRYAGHTQAHDALDLGVALLVKTLPLVRVATAYSCDGHGVEEARVDLHFPWDRPWCQEVVGRLLVGPRHARWDFNGNTLSISSPHGYGDAEVIGFLNDVQRFARRTLDASLIETVGAARAATLQELGEAAPSLADFAACASRQLDAALGPRESATSNSETLPHEEMAR